MSPEKTDRGGSTVGCRHPGCSGQVEAAVPLWLTLDADGSWFVYAVGDESAEIICDKHEHDNFTVVLHKSLSAFLDELLPNSTWNGSAPPRPRNEQDP